MPELPTLTDRYKQHRIPVLGVVNILQQFQAEGGYIEPWKKFFSEVHGQRQPLEEASY